MTTLNNKQRIKVKFKLNLQDESYNLIIKKF